MVVVRDCQPPELRATVDEAELVAFLQSLLGTDCHVFVFQGQRCPVTVAPHHLRLPDGRALPLFPQPSADDLEPLADGFLGAAVEQVEVDLASPYMPAVDLDDPALGPVVDAERDEDEEEDDGLLGHDDL